MVVMDITLIIPVILGWLAGLFINYASDVLPFTRRFSKPVCRACQAEFSLADYVTLRACRNCGARRSLRTWLVQILAVGSFVYFWLFPSRALGIPLGMIVLIYFGIITVIDLEHRLILHVTSLAGALLGLAIGVWLRGWSSTLLGGLAGFAGMLGLYYLGFLFLVVIKRLRGKSTSEVALGFGDVMLSGVLGLLLGWPGILAGLYLAIFIGAIFSLVYLISMALLGRYKAFTPIPYGPFLVLSAVLLLFFKHIFI